MAILELPYEAKYVVSSCRCCIGTWFARPMAEVGKATMSAALATIEWLPSQPLALEGEGGVVSSAHKRTICLTFQRIFAKV